jgi:hypothetical protein
MFNINNLVHYGDLLAIPFFGLSTFYFLNKDKKNYTEYLLLVFSIAGLLLDIFFTYLFYQQQNNKIL